MPPDGLTHIGVILAAIFLVPQLMSILPDFDPLMMLVCLFGFLALLQQLSFSGGPQGQAQGESPQRPQRSQQGPQEPATTSTSDLLQEAERCLAQNSWSAVKKIAKQITDADPENARAWELLATAQKWEGKREEAAATVERARDLYEVDSPGLRELAQELSHGSSPENTVQERESKGEDFLSRRQYDLASECFTKALEALGNAPGDEKAAIRLRLLRRRAECSQQLQDWSLCRQDATAVLEASPEDQRALLQRAAANEALEKFKAAMEDARRLLALDPKNAAANRIVHHCNQALKD